MKVLVVTTRWDLIGGSERYAGVVSVALAESGCEVAVLTAEGEQRAAVKVLRFAELGSAKLSRGQRAGLRDVARGFTPDVIYLLSRVCAGALQVLLEVAPLVRFVQDHTLFCPGLNKLHEDGAPCLSALGLACLDRYYTKAGCSGLKRDGLPSLRFPLGALDASLRELELTRRAKQVLVASNYMRAELLRAGLPRDLVRVLPYFTPSEPRAVQAQLPSATRAFLERDERPLLFTPARLTLPDKGIDYLLTALGKLQGRAKLLVAGDGPARAWLEEKARDEGLEGDVHFSGWLDPAELETLYTQASIVIFPSVWDEPFGLVGLEAMAHSKPVVAFDVGGVSDWLVHGETGLLCERRDAHALARATASLLDAPTLGSNLGRAGHLRAAQRFSREGHISALQELLQVAPTPLAWQPLGTPPPASSTPAPCSASPSPRSR